MKILLIAPIHRYSEYLKQKERLPFLRGQGQQSWVEALEELGHEVFVFKYTDSILIPQSVLVAIQEIFKRHFPKLWARSQRFCDRYYKICLENYVKNNKLLVLARKVKPQVVIISGGANCLFPKTIEEIKQTYNSKVILFSGVNPKYASTSSERELIKDKVIDYVIENDQGYAKLWEELGAKKTIVLPISSVDPALHKRVKLSNVEKEEYGCEVCFVGTLTKERQEKLVQLTEFNLKIWGDIPSGIGLLSKLKPHYHGTAHGEKMVKVFNAAKIVLNFQPPDMTHGGNMRSFEILGCGTFQLADSIDSRWFKEGKEYMSFKSVEDLKRKIAYCLVHEEERKNIANNGYKRARAEHTYKDHFKKILAYL